MSTTVAAPGSETFELDCTFDIEEDHEKLSISNLLLLREARRRGWVARVLDSRLDLIGLYPTARRADSVPTGVELRPLVFRRSASELTSFSGSVLVDDKASTDRLMRGHLGAFMPPTLTLFNTAKKPADPSEAAEFLARHKRLVVKPIAGAHGDGVTVNITTEERVATAVARALKANGGDHGVLVQKHVEGSVDIRALVIGGRVCAATARRPPSAVGDGKSTIGELVAKLNEHPWRGTGHTSPLTFIDAAEVGEFVDGGLERVPAEGESVILLGTCNLSKGAIAVDVTDFLHESIVRLVESAASLCGLPIAGVDLMCIDEPTDASVRPEPGSVHLIEVNKCPGLRMHHFPLIGKPRNAAKMIIDEILRTRTALYDVRVPSVSLEKSNLRMLVMYDSATSKPTNSLGKLIHQLVVDAPHHGCEVWIATRRHPFSLDFFGECTTTKIAALRVGLDDDCGALLRTDASDPRWVKTDVRTYDVLFLRIAASTLTPGWIERVGEHFPERRVLNGLMGCLRTAQKDWLVSDPELAALCPPSQLVKSFDDIQAFREAEASDVGVVVKPFGLNGGKGIMRINAEGTRVCFEANDWLDIGADERTQIEANLNESAHVAVRFLRGVREHGDKRVLVCCGEVVGAVLRRSSEGGWLCNGAQGGTSHAAQPDDDERRIASILARRLRLLGVVLFGFDTLMGDNGHRVLSEVNSMNVGGLQQAEETSGKPVLHVLAELLWREALARINCPFL